MDTRHKASAMYDILKKQVGREEGERVRVRVRCLFVLPRVRAHTALSR